MEITRDTSASRICRSPSKILHNLRVSPINLFLNILKLLMICSLLDIFVHNQAGIKFDKNKDSMNYGNIVLYSAEHQTYNENMNYQRMRDRLKEKQVSHL